MIRLIRELWDRLINFNIDNSSSLWGGLIWIWSKSTDFVFGSSLDFKKKLKEKGIINRQVKWEYNQGAQYKTRNWCTVYSAVTEISWLQNYHFSLSEIEEIWDKMIKDWKLNPNRGAHLSDAIDYSRRWRNEKFPKKQIESYLIRYDDEETRNLLTSVKPRLTQLWYKTSPELFREVQSTWIASKKTYPRKWGHAVSQWGLTTINNYKGKMLWDKEYKNRFSFTHFDRLVANRVIFRAWYVFLRK